MSDPKNIPLSEARPGDMVFLKPLTVIDRSDRYIRGSVSDADYVLTINAGFIDHIERAPRPLEVGCRVRLKKSDAKVGVLLCIHEGVAWVDWQNIPMGKSTEYLASLERVDG